MVQCVGPPGRGVQRRLGGARRVAQAVYSRAVAGSTTYDCRGGGASGTDQRSNADGQAYGRANLRPRPGTAATAAADAGKSWQAETIGFRSSGRYVSGGGNRALRSPSPVLRPRFFGFFGSAR